MNFKGEDVRDAQQGNVLTGCMWTVVYVYVATLCYVICYVATLGTLNRGTC